jgi:hypothetical protein
MLSYMERNGLLFPNQADHSQQPSATGYAEID